MKRLFSLILAMALTFSCFAGCSPAGEAKTVVVGYTSYAPMNYFDDNGKLIGGYSKGEYARFLHAVKAYTPEEIVIESRDGEFCLCLDGEVSREKRVVIRLSGQKVNVFGPAGFDCNATAKS